MGGVNLINISKQYDRKINAIQSFTLNIREGEFIVLVGPSGCGKSTTLRIIAGLETTDTGDIYIGSQRVNELPPKDRDIAMVFQNYALYPHMSIYNNMAFGLKLRGCSPAEIDRRVRDVSQLLEIVHLLGHKPKTLSGGQRQRVALGRAMVRRPKVFLFDEPLSNLDAKLRASTRSELKAIHQRLGITSIYVTHDQIEAMTLGDRICIMNQGMIQQVGMPVEVYDWPVNRFVAGFLGSPPMNFLNGRVEQNDGKICFFMSTAQIVLPIVWEPRLNNFLGQNLTLGIRPAQMSTVSYPNQTNNQISGTVYCIEPLGDVAAVHLLLPDKQKITILADPHTSPQINTPLTFFINLDRIHLFESGPFGKAL